MTVAAIIVGAAILFAIALVLSVVGDSLEHETLDAPDAGLPTDRPVTSADVPGLRFRVGLRGYRMADVDQAIDQLETALRTAEHRAKGNRVDGDPTAR